MGKTAMGAALNLGLHHEFATHLTVESWVYFQALVSLIIIIYTTAVPSYPEGENVTNWQDGSCIHQLKQGLDLENLQLKDQTMNVPLQCYFRLPTWV